MTTPEQYQDIRDAVAKLCAKFGNQNFAAVAGTNTDIDALAMSVWSMPQYWRGRERI